jgi:hypothetical protein
MGSQFFYIEYWWSPVKEYGQEEVELDVRGDFELDSGGSD